jgi:hypothetical protein
MFILALVVGDGYILIAEDDPDDRLLIKTAFDDIGMRTPLRFVEKIMRTNPERGCHTTKGLIGPSWSICG